MLDRTHFGPVLAVLGELVRAGAAVRVWSESGFRAEIEAAGAEFTDLFSAGSVVEADSESIPRTVRYVTFAGLHGARVAQEAALWRPDMVLSEAFALIAQVVARRLDLPWVKVMSGHAVHGPTYRASIERDHRTLISARCLEAVALLRDEYGLRDATPFSYISDPSPWLNLCKEPEEWMTPEERAQLGPMAYFGSLPSNAFERLANRAPSDSLRIYVSFGTIIWRYWTEQATAAFMAILEASRLRQRTSVVIGLGGGDIPHDARSRLTAAGVRVETFADQWAELGEADIFVTHAGAGSVHEAVAQGVPMLTFPFFWDQPAEARRAQELGLALPLIDDVAEVSTLTADHFLNTLEELLSQLPAIRESLVIAQGWERRTLARRAQVAAQVLAVGR